MSAGVAVVDDRGATVYGRAEPGRRHARQAAVVAEVAAATVDAVQPSVTDCHVLWSICRPLDDRPAPSVVVSACTSVWNVPTDLYGVITGDNSERGTPCVRMHGTFSGHTRNGYCVLCWWASPGKLQHVIRTMRVIDARVVIVLKSAYRHRACRSLPSVCPRVFLTRQCAYML